MKLALKASATDGAGDKSRATSRVARRDPFWPAQLTALAAIVLYVALPEKLTVGPTWLVPPSRACCWWG